MPILVGTFWFEEVKFETEWMLTILTRTFVNKHCQWRCEQHARDGILDFVPETEKHVLDGGSLLHRILWRQSESYGAIAQSYAYFTVRQNCACATFVFDRYEQGPSI